MIEEFDSSSVGGNVRIIGKEIYQKIKGLNLGLKIGLSIPHFEESV